MKKRVEQLVTVQVVRQANAHLIGRSGTEVRTPALGLNQVSRPTRGEIARAGEKALRSMNSRRPATA